MNTDRLIHISLLEGQARALLIEGTQLVEEARRTHNLSRIASAALGRTLMATAMLGSSLKGKGESITASIRGGGPIGAIVAVGRPGGVVKGYVDNPQVELPRTGPKLPVGAAVGIDGRLTVVKDLNMGEPYVGQVNLVSGEIAEDFAMYFTASEQIPSLVALGVLVQDTIIAAGGLIIQALPGASEAAIQSIELSANIYANISSTIRDYGAHGAIEQLLSHLQPVILEEIKPRYECDCSRERIERALISLGEKELRDMIADGKGAHVECYFCDKEYSFDDNELSALLNEALTKNEAEAE